MSPKAVVEVFESADVGVQALRFILETFFDVPLRGYRIVENSPIDQEENYRGPEQRWLVIRADSPLGAVNASVMIEACSTCYQRYQPLEASVKVGHQREREFSFLKGLNGYNPHDLFTEVRLMIGAADLAIARAVCAQLLHPYVLTEKLKHRVLIRPYCNGSAEHRLVFWLPLESQKNYLIVTILDVLGRGDFKATRMELHYGSVEKHLELQGDEWVQTYPQREAQDD